MALFVLVVAGCSQPAGGSGEETGKGKGTGMGTGARETEAEPATGPAVARR